MNSTDGVKVTESKGMLIFKGRQCSYGLAVNRVTDIIINHPWKEEGVFVYEEDRAPTKGTCFVLVVSGELSLLRLMDDCFHTNLMSDNATGYYITGELEKALEQFYIG